MTVLEISDIIRKENYIYYRREFTGNAQYSLPGHQFNGKIEFTIETAPTGKKDIQIKMLDPVDYPLIPLHQALKKFILDLDYEGKLP